MTVEAVQGQERVPLAARLALNADGILEQIAREYGVSTLEVVRNLLPDHRSVVDGSAFESVMQDVTMWGDILFIVHTPDIVLECAGPLPPGTFGRGYYNVHGEEPDRRSYPRRELCRDCVRIAPLHGAAVAIDPVLQHRWRSDVQDLRAPRRDARAHRRSGWEIRRVT